MDTGKKTGLTQLSKTCGCAAKIGPKTLSQVLGGLPRFHDGNLLVGFETSDDAAVYQITDKIAMIQTVDFFPPMVDDPYIFGQIAAANALSDVYAMGGEPKVALNIVAFPSCLDSQVLGEVLRGGAEKVKEAGAVLVGGHSIQDDEPKYGLCVSGFVHPERILKNFGCRPNDMLILTKQIGSGVVNTAVKAGIASPEAKEEVIRVMSSLNKKAKEILEKYPVTACTDVTGFGLLGHGVEMASASEVTLEIHTDSIAFMQDAADYAQMGLIPAGAYRNREYVGKQVDVGTTEQHFLDLLYDPQTSGGLLFSVAPEYVDAILRDFENAEMETKVSVIGKAVHKGNKKICLI